MGSVPRRCRIRSSSQALETLEYRASIRRAYRQIPAVPNITSAVLVAHAIHTFSVHVHWSRWYGSYCTIRRCTYCVRVAVCSAFQKPRHKLSWTHGRSWRFHAALIADLAGSPSTLSPMMLEAAKQSAKLIPCGTAGIPSWSPEPLQSVNSRNIFRKRIPPPPPAPLHSRTFEIGISAEFHWIFSSFAEYMRRCYWNSDIVLL